MAEEELPQSRVNYYSFTKDSLQLKN
jgi:hypothetical protein